MNWIERRPERTAGLQVLLKPAKLVSRKLMASEICPVRMRLVNWLRRTCRGRASLSVIGVSLLVFRRRSTFLAKEEVTSLEGAMILSVSLLSSKAELSTIAWLCRLLRMLCWVCNLG